MDICRSEGMCKPSPFKSYCYIVRRGSILMATCLKDRNLDIHIYSFVHFKHRLKWLKYY